MATTKITDLTAYTDPVNTDVLPIVDVTSDVTKKVSIANVMKNASLGTAALPGISFDGDPNTGIYSPGADAVAVTTGGTQRLLIDSAGAVTIAGDLTVNGTTTNINTQNLVVEDKNVVLGDVATPTDVTADGGGITLKGATDKTINWVDATDAWTSSERFSYPLGSAAAPTLTFTGDANTGIYSPGADQVAISTNGTGRLFVDASGRVGVGTTPSYTLDVVGSTSAARIGKLNILDDSPFVTGANLAASSTFAMGTQTASPTVFFTNNTERLRITSAGLVGIGSSAPQELLNVNGNILVGVDGTATASEKIIRSSNTSTSFGNDTGANLVLQSGAGTGQYGSSIQFRTPQPSSIANTLGTQTTRMTIDTQGRVGIGTTPGTDNRLHIADTSKAATARTGVKLQTTDSLAADTGLPVVWSGNIGTQSDYTWASITGRKENATSGQAGGYLQFATGSSGGAVEERVRITSTGAVGIGTTPLSKFHVNLATNENIHFSGGSGDTRIGSYNDAFNTTVQLSIQGSPLLFRSAGGLEAARIDSSSRLLVGTSTARANFFNQASTYAPKIQLEGSDASSGGTMMSAVCAGSNAFSGYLILGKHRGSVGGTPTIVNAGDVIGSVSFQAGDGSEMVETASINAEIDTTPGANDMPGRLVFSTTADGASSPTERMRITNGGKVLIGTTSDLALGGESLQVSGTGNPATFKTSRDGISGASYWQLIAWNSGNSGDNGFIQFGTETSYTSRGSITYNRGSAVVAYNTTSDYRAKTILGSVTDSGETIDALKVYRGLMNDATVERPMLIAHEAQEVAPYCVTGEKDAVDDDGNPIYQQIDHQVLVPLLIAEIQQLRARVAALEGA